MNLKIYYIFFIKELYNSFYFFLRLLKLHYLGYKFDEISQDDSILISVFTSFS